MHNQETQISVLRYRIHVGTSAQSQYRCDPLHLVYSFFQMFDYSCEHFKTAGSRRLSRFIFVQNVLWFDALSDVVVWSFIPFVRSILLVWCRLVHDDLDDKILLDLGVLQAGLVCEELSREEPALLSQLNVLLSL